MYEGEAVFVRDGDGDGSGNKLEPPFFVAAIILNTSLTIKMK